MLNCNNSGHDFLFLHASVETITILLLIFLCCQVSN